MDIIMATIIIARLAISFAALIGAPIFIVAICSRIGGNGK